MTEKSPGPLEQLSQEYSEIIYTKLSKLLQQHRNKLLQQHKEKSQVNYLKMTYINKNTENDLENEIFSDTSLKYFVNNKILLKIYLLKRNSNIRVYIETNTEKDILEDRKPFKEHIKTFLYPNKNPNNPNKENFEQEFLGYGKLWEICENETKLDDKTKDMRDKILSLVKKDEKTKTTLQQIITKDYECKRRDIKYITSSKLLKVSNEISRITKISSDLIFKLLLVFTSKKCMCMGGSGIHLVVKSFKTIVLKERLKEDLIIPEATKAKYEKKGKEYCLKEKFREPVSYYVDAVNYKLIRNSIDNLENFVDYVLHTSDPARNEETASEITLLLTDIQIQENVILLILLYPDVYALLDAFLRSNKIENIEIEYGKKNWISYQKFENP